MKPGGDGRGGRRLRRGLPGGIVLPSGIAHLTESQEQTARGVYGWSLDFSRIYITDGLGLDRRGFTCAINLSVQSWLPDRWVVVINCGTLSPSRDTSSRAPRE